MKNSRPALSEKIQKNRRLFMTKSNIQRGDIFYVTDDPENPAIGAEIWANRAGIIISNPTICKTSRAVQIVYISTSKNKRLSPTHIQVTSGNKQAIAICEQVHTVDISRLTDYFGHVNDEEMENVEGGVLFGQGINRGKNPQGIFKKWENYIRTYHLPTTSEITLR